LTGIYKTPTPLDYFKVQVCVSKEYKEKKERKKDRKKERKKEREKERKTKT
jgi:hypothetical protein